VYEDVDDWIIVIPDRHIPSPFIDISIVRLIYLLLLCTSYIIEFIIIFNDMCFAICIVVILQLRIFERLLFYIGYRVIVKNGFYVRVTHIQ